MNLKSHLIFIIFLIVSLNIIISSCVNHRKLSTVEDYTTFLYENMSLADSITYTQGFWEANVKKTLEVRERMNWDIPEREFNYFVLPLRVNNEDLDDFRLIYADTLCERVKGMSLYDAVLEINHWCHEMVTYAPSDARTSSPLATIRKGLGRCGEESVLTVSALRAAGIPARQIYTPRWAHTDDNHAWVEAYIDGTWYFLGACEPEPKLNMAWFNAPVSRAMLLNTKVFGKNYDGPEEVIKSTLAYKEINVTSNYVPVRELIVKVVDKKGRAVQDALVNFTIYNYSEFYTVASYKSDSNGVVKFTTGEGDMVVFAYKEDDFGILNCSYSEDNSENNSTTNRKDNYTLTLNHSIGEEFELDIKVTPPKENPLPTLATEEEIANNKIRFERENQIREARPKGNDAVLNSFRDSLTTNELKKRVELLLNSLSTKDLNDVTLDVLNDALNHSLFFDGDFEPYRDSPRVEREFLLPYFSHLSAQIPNLKSVDEIINWVNDNIDVNDSSNPQHLRISPIKVFQARKSDSKSLNIFFVALCRAKGFSARIDPITSKTQYRNSNGEWIDVELFETDVKSKLSPKGFLTLNYSSTAKNEPEYYKNFSISKVFQNGHNLLNLNEDANLSLSTIFNLPMELDRGYYLITSGIRGDEGGTMVHLHFFNLNENSTKEIELLLNKSEVKVNVLGKIELDKIVQIDEIEKDTNLFLLAFLGGKDEPSTHARRQLNSLVSSLKGVRVVVKIMENSQPSDTEIITTSLNLNPSQLPIIVLANRDGEIYYSSQGYNTSLREGLKKLLEVLAL